MSSLASLGAIPTGRVSKLKQKTGPNEKEKQYLAEISKNPLSAEQIVKKDKKALENLIGMGMLEVTKAGASLTEKGKSLIK